MLAGEHRLLWLILAVGNSTFIEQFYDKSFNNKLYAGRRRFMTQYVQKFPLPSPKTKLGKKLITFAQTIFNLLPDNDTAELEKEARPIGLGIFWINWKRNFWVEPFEFYDWLRDLQSVESV